MGNWYSIRKEFPVTLRDRTVWSWIPDLPDIRDTYIKFPELVDTSENQHESVDLRPKMLKLESNDSKVTGPYRASLMAFEFDKLKQKTEYERDNDELFIGSPSFIYFNARVITNNTEVDSGVSIRDCLKVIDKLGVCPKEACENDNIFYERPQLKAYEMAKNMKGIKYRRIHQDEKEIKYALTLNYPVIFGFSVYESFDEETTKFIVSPRDDEPLIGGHSGLICGFDNKKKCFIVRTFRDFYVPYSYILNTKLCRDFWILESEREQTYAKIVKSTINTPPTAEEIENYKSVSEAGFSNNDSDSNNNNIDNNDSDSDEDLPDECLVFSRN